MEKARSSGRGGGLAIIHRAELKLSPLQMPDLKEIKPGSPSVFKLPLKKNDIRIDGCKRYTFGKESMKPNRTVMFLGATGSGKSTLINGMINYILGIDWKDSFRFKLINEDQSRSQAESQTTHVTTYEINHREGFKVPYSLTLVDTPGFGDTRGIESDKAIREQIRSLFTSAKGVFEIDAICFVTQASQVRLTASQKYVFDSVLSIFGKDVVENICILVTFADGQQPPVLEAINAAKIPCPKTDKDLPVHHKFNNSALFAENKSFSDRFDAMFWAMGASSMETFFISLGHMTTKSLQLTKEVLNERKQLEAAVEGIQPQVRAGLAKLEQIRSTKQQIEKYNADIAFNENFQFEVEIIKPVQIPTNEGEFLTNCQECNITCHSPCYITDDEQKFECAAMKDEKCTVCPGKCVWTIHFNQKYRWDYVKEKHMKTIQQVKDKYEKATEAKITVEELIGHQAEEVLNLQDEIMSLMDTSSRCIARLKEIALRPNPLSTPEYIELLIEGEKSEGKKGYLARIQSLENMKGNAQIMVKASKREKLTEIEEEYIEDSQKRKEKKGFKSKMCAFFKGDWL
uniref:AIG1-type G domain-containing protein n=1 Tax=Gadus morhua TaxID=8049 RepID=A0A8C4ZT70_GADMO